MRLLALCNDQWLGQLLVSYPQGTSPLSCKTGIGSRVTPMQLRRKQQSATPPGLPQAHGPRWDPPEGAEGAVGSAHQVVLHHTSAVLVSGEAPGDRRLPMRHPSTRRVGRRIRGAPVLSA